MNRFAALFITFLFSVAPLTLQAQGDSTFLYTGSEIIGISGGTIVETISLPEQAKQLQSVNSFDPVGLSPDLRYFVFADDQVILEGQSRSYLRIADLTNQTCCVTAQDPTENGAEVIGVGSFSPDNTQIVVTFNRAYSMPIETYTAVIDLETGAIVHQANTQEAFDVPIILIEDWTEEGIMFAPVGCFPCGGAPGSHYMLWNPDSDSVITTEKLIATFGDRLESTGEIILAQRDEAYPVSNADGMIQPFNVIVATNDKRSETTVVFHDPKQLELSRPRWVMNGEAYLIQLWSQPFSFVVGRNGQVWTIPVGSMHRFLSSTTDGWLMSDDDTGTLYAFQLQDDEWLQIDLGQYQGQVRVLQSPIIGNNVAYGLMVVQ